MRGTGKKSQIQIIKWLDKKQDELANAVQHLETRRDGTGGVLTQLEQQIVNYTTEREKSLKSAHRASDAKLKAEQEEAQEIEKLNKIRSNINEAIEEFSFITQSIEYVKGEYEELRKQTINDLKSQEEQAEKEKEKLNKKIDELETNRRRMIDESQEAEKLLTLKEKRIQELDKELDKKNDLVSELEVAKKELNENKAEIEKTQLDKKIMKQKLLEVQRSLKEERRLKMKNK